MVAQNNVKSPLPKVLVLWNDTDDSEDLPVTQATEERLQALVSALQSGGFEVVLANADDDPDTIGDALVVYQPALVFNLVDHFFGDNTQHAAIAHLLELYGYPYTGSDALCLATCQDRARTRIMLRASGVETPAFLVVQSAGDPKDDAILRGPLVVSQALDDCYADEPAPDSLVMTLEDAARCIESLSPAFAFPFLVEERPDCSFLSVVVLATEDGRTTTLPPCEWKMNDGERSYVPIELEPTVKAAAAKSAELAYLTMGCRDIAQIDFSLDHTHTPRCTDVRPVIDFLSVDGVFKVAAEASSMGYAGAVTAVAKRAHARLALLDPVKSADALPEAETAPL